MNDDQLNREIEQALSVEPSPQFAVRVRARIAESRRPSRLWIKRSVAAAAGLAAAAIVTLAFLKPQESEISRPLKSIAKVAAEVTERPAQPAPQPAPIVVSQAAAPLGPEEPEVLIDPREVTAFRKFVEGVQADRIDLAKLIELQQSAVKTAPIEEIALMPIGDLEPIVIESLTFGVRRIEGGSL